MCQTQQTLIKSHIISKFNARKMHKGKGKDDVVGVSESGSSQTKPGGHWQHLLCAACDNGLGKDTENMAAQILYHGQDSIIQAQDDVCILRGVDYPSMRLYGLSTLWKMSVSTLPYFDFVSLGGKHEENLRSAINARSTLDNDYPIVFSTLMVEERVLSANIRPFTATNGESRFVILVTNGIMMQFFFEGYDNDEIVRHVNFDSSGDLGVVKIQFFDIPFFRDRFAKVAYANADLGNDE